MKVEIIKNEIVAQSIAHNELKHGKLYRYSYSPNGSHVVGIVLLDLNDYSLRFAPLNESEVAILFTYDLKTSGPSGKFYPFNDKIVLSNEE